MSTLTPDETFGADHSSLGTTYNAFTLQEARDYFEVWAATEYPLLWDQLKKKGKRTKLIEQYGMLDADVTDLRIERQFRA